MMIEKSLMRATGLLDGSVVKNLLVSVKDMGLIPGPG